MVRYKSNNQISIEDFSTPFQQKLRSDNRWVKLSKIIPWDRLAAIYSKTMTEDFGRPGIDPRRVIGAMVIKHKLNLSDEETVLQIQENAYLQYFLGYSTYEEEPVFAPSLFVEIRKRIGAEKFDEMNRAIIETALARKKPAKRREKSSSKGSGPKGGEPKKDTEESANSGKLIMDATVAEQATGAKTR